MIRVFFRMLAARSCFRAEMLLFWLFVEQNDAGIYFEWVHVATNMPNVNIIRNPKHFNTDWKTFNSWIGIAFDITCWPPPVSLTHNSIYITLVPFAAHSVLFYFQISFVSDWGSSFHRWFRFHSTCLSVTYAGCVWACAVLCMSIVNAVCNVYIYIFLWSGELHVCDHIKKEKLSWISQLFHLNWDKF